MRHHFFVCCIVNYLNSFTSFIYFQQKYFDILNIYNILIYLPVLLLIIVMDILFFVFILNRIFLHPRNGFVIFFSNVLLTVDVQILCVFNKDWYSFYTHLILSVLFTFITLKERIKRVSIHEMLIFGFEFIGVFLFVYFLNWIANFIDIKSMIMSPVTISDLATYR